MDECIFNAYNKRWEKDHDPVDSKGFADAIRAFRDGTLYAKIIDNADYHTGIRGWILAVNEDVHKFTEWVKGGGGTLAARSHGGSKRMREDTVPSDGARAERASRSKGSGLVNPGMLPFLPRKVAAAMREEDVAKRQKAAGAEETATEVKAEVRAEAA